MWICEFVVEQKNEPKRIWKAERARRRPISRDLDQSGRLEASIPASGAPRLGAALVAERK